MVNFKHACILLSLLAGCGGKAPGPARTAAATRIFPATAVASVNLPGPLSAARDAVRRLDADLRAAGVVPAGEPLLFINSEAAESLRYEACVPVPPGTAGFAGRELAPFTLLSAVVPGATPETTITALLDWLAANPGYRVSGPAVEIYLPGSRTEVGIVVSPAP